MCVSQPGEDLETLLKLQPEEILLRWFNYHLAQAGSTRRVANFGRYAHRPVCRQGPGTNGWAVHREGDGLATRGSNPRQAVFVRSQFHLGLPDFLHPSAVPRDLEDAEAYSILLHQLSPSLCDLAREPTHLGRATHVIRNAKALGVPAFLQVRLGTQEWRAEGERSRALAGNRGRMGGKAGIGET